MGNYQGWANRNLQELNVLILIDTQSVFIRSFRTFSHFRLNVKPWFANSICANCGLALYQQTMNCN